MEELESTASSEVWNFVWQTFANASMTYDLVSCQNGTKGSIEDNTWLDNPAKLGILTGFFIACLADFRIATPKYQLDVGVDSKLKTMAIILINVFSFLLLAPIVSGTLFVFYLYKKIVEFTLRMQLRDEFAGLLVGTDCIWALEETTALSVINVLAVLEKTDFSSEETFLINFRNLIKKRLVESNLDKLNWYREKKYGYFYWHRTDELPIEERVRWLDDPEDEEKKPGFCEDIHEDFMKAIFAKATNKPLPRDHSASWEILVGRTWARTASNRLEEMEEYQVDVDDVDIGEKTAIPVLFRVHHCLGDGVALLRLLLESIADTESVDIERALDDTKNNHTIRLPLLRASSSVLGTVSDGNEIVYYENDLLSASMPFTTRNQFRTILKTCLSYVDASCELLKRSNIKATKDDAMKRLEVSWKNFKGTHLDSVQRKINEVGKILAVLISIPTCLVQQTLRSMDNSALHGPTLSGEKIISYWMETETKNLHNANLLSKIRDIKNATGTRFGDVVLAALSANLLRYFGKIGEAAPKTMSVVIPARMTMPSQKLSLQNGFSVGLLSLCVSEVNGESVEYDYPEDSRLLERLNDISRCSDKLRNDPDYLINFWVMKWLSAALPEWILRPVLESHSTLVFSNLPGPQEVTILGKKLKNVAFWIPHRCKTGVGCSFLTYGGKVHISLIADCAVMRSQRLLDEILRDTVDDIEKLYETISLSCFAINLRDKSDAPTETGLGVL